MTVRRLRLIDVGVLATVLAVAGLLVSAQTPSAGRETSAASVARYGLSQSMPVDPEVTVGTLPNGLRYYVRANAKPARRAELRLVVRAGSVLEDDDQQGLAHFVEHVEFEGTEHFPRQGIVDFLSSLGLSIGADANAATSYDDTQYTLRVPTDVPGALDRALLILEDWAHAASFDQSGIDRQRGIVLSEWRMGLGAGERTNDKIRGVQLDGSRYAARSPIGKPDVIEHAQREQLLRFYRDWYRPDLMAVVVVGDVNRDAVAGMIQRHFSPLVSPSPARPRPAFDVPEHAGTRYAIVADKESTATMVQLTNLRPARNQGTVGGYRQMMLDQLFAGMLDARLDELSQRANPPFLRADSQRGLFVTPRTRDEAVLQALVANEGVPAGLDALLTELRRVTRFGFTPTEFARAKQAMMLGFERVVREGPDRESDNRVDEYTRNFLQGEALPTIWQELAFHRRFLPAVTLAEVNALATEWFPDSNRLVIVSAPEAAGVKVPDQATLAGVVKSAAAKRVDPYVDAAAGETLMSTAPRPGTIVKTTARDSGITEWTLSNGARVVIKPTTLKEDQILFRAEAPGGTSVAADADFIAARNADTLVAASGVGRFNAVTLDKILAGRALAVLPFIDEFGEGMGGGSTPQDLEGMFQLLYLRFTQPRADPAAFASTMTQAKSMLANQMASPGVVFNETLDTILNSDHPRRRRETPAGVDQWNLAKSLAYYKARFADASNFTFVLVGSFTPAKIKPLVETYIASLPSTHAHETWRDLGIAPPPGVIERTVEKGIAPKSQVGVVFSGPFEYDDAHRLALRTVSLVLQSRLFDAIRQELGGTYSITVSPVMVKVPRPEYSVRIDWTCDPARTAMLVQRVFDEIAAVRATRFSQGQMAVVRDNLLRELEMNSQDNRFILDQIARRYADGTTAEGAILGGLQDQIAALSADDLQRAAQTYLDPKRYVKVTLMPETK